jgi:uncharacterized protein YjbJ (UPF0337 family)
MATGNGVVTDLTNVEVLSKEIDRVDDTKELGVSTKVVTDVKGANIGGSDSSNVHIDEPQVPSQTLGDEAKVLAEDVYDQPEVPVEESNDQLETPAEKIDNQRDGSFEEPGTQPDAEPKVVAEEQHDNVSDPVVELDDNIKDPVEELHGNVSDPVVELDDKIKDPVEELRENFSDPVEELDGKIKDQVEELHENVSDPVEELDGKIKDQVEELHENVSDPVEELDDKIKDPVEELHEELKATTEELQSAVDAFVTSQKEGTLNSSSRSKIIDAAEKILSTVKEPAGQWMERSVQMGLMGATHIFQIWEAFDHIPKEGSISFVELAQKLDAEVSVIGKLPLSAGSTRRPPSHVVFPRAHQRSPHCNGHLEACWNRSHRPHAQVPHLPSGQPNWRSLSACVCIIANPNTFDM